MTVWRNWIARWTSDPAVAGSNPVTVANTIIIFFFFDKKKKKKIINKKYIQKPMARFELATLCLQGRCTNHCATSAIKYNIKTINIIIIFFFFYIFLLAFKIQKKKKKQNKTKNIICLEWDSNPRIRR
jgi:hypothetical protein